jgi:hypothetical protein
MMADFRLETLGVLALAALGSSCTAGTVSSTAVPKSDDARLSGLVVSQAALSPDFDSEVTRYEASVANEIAAVTVIPTAAQADGSITVLGTPVASGAATVPAALAVGETTINIVVTAPNGVTQRTYTVTVTRRAAASSNADLASLSLSPGTLVPSFSAAATSYTVSEVSSVGSVTVSATAAESGAAITVQGVGALSGVPSSPVQVVAGANLVIVVVTAPDGTTQKTYSANVVVPAGCVTSGSIWSNTAIAAQTASFTVELDATPGGAAIDADVGLSTGAASAYANLAMIVDFGTDGLLRARDGGAYAAATSVSYTADVTYHVRLVGDVATHTYSVYVTAPSGPEQTLASGYAFRTEQGSVSSLANWGTRAESGSLQVCNVEVKAGQGSLVVTPASGLLSSGATGGPFAPSSVVLTLSNTETQPVNWTAAVTQAWVSLSSASGTLAPQGTAPLTVSLSAPVASLGAGIYADTVTITNVTTGRGTTTRPVQVTVSSGTSVTYASSITQFGITWTFDQAYPTGQFANGDYWVVGPVQIVDITPRSTVEASGRIINGSMLNPAIQTAQGFDSLIYGTYQPADYAATLNVGRPGGQEISASNPLTIGTGTLVSGISYTDAQLSSPSQTNRVHAMSALTVLSGVPAAGSFRPPLTGADKTVRHNASEMHYDLLPNLTPPSGVSCARSTAESCTGLSQTLTRVVATFEKIRPDFNPTWLGKQNFLPEDNMPPYGADVADGVSNAALLLSLDLGDETTKRLLALRMTQIGLDDYAMTQQPGGLTNWIANGGHTCGRVFPLLFAGWMLQDSAMMAIMAKSGHFAYENGHTNYNVPADYIHFGEIDQTFYVSQREVDMTHGVGGYGAWSPDSRDVATPYEAADIGKAEWGINHCDHPTRDNATWDCQYRSTNSVAWSGFVLASRIMGIKSLYNHDPLFDWMTRWMSVEGANGAYHRPFQQSMWDKLNASYP